MNQPNQCSFCGQPLQDKSDWCPCRQKLFRDADSAQGVKLKNTENDATANDTSSQSNTYGDLPIKFFTPDASPDVPKSSKPAAGSWIFLICSVLFCLVMAFLYVQKFQSQHVTEAKVKDLASASDKIDWADPSASQPGTESLPPVNLTTEVVLPPPKSASLQQDGQVETVHMSKDDFGIFPYDHIQLSIPLANDNSNHPAKYVDSIPDNKRYKIWIPTLVTERPPQHYGDANLVQQADLRNNFGADKIINYLTICPLNNIEIAWSDIDDKTCSTLGSIKSIQSIAIDGNLGITINGLRSVMALPNLSALSMARMELKKADFLELARSVPNLRVLDLANNPEVDDEVLESLIDNHPQLESLSVSGCKITAKSFRLLNKLQQLKSLSICHLPITDKDLSVLRNMPLRQLSMTDGKLKGNGLDNLATCKDLNWISIACIRNRTTMSLSSVEKLRKALPKCTIGYSDKLQMPVGEDLVAERKKLKVEARKGRERWNLAAKQKKELESTYRNRSMDFDRGENR